MKVHKLHIHPPTPTTPVPHLAIKLRAECPECYTTLKQIAIGTVKADLNLQCPNCNRTTPLILHFL